MHVPRAQAALGVIPLLHVPAFTLNSRGKPAILDRFRLTDLRILLAFLRLPNKAFFFPAKNTVTSATFKVCLKLASWCGWKPRRKSEGWLQSTFGLPASSLFTHHRISNVSSVSKLTLLSVEPISRLPSHRTTTSLPFAIFRSSRKASFAC